MTVGIGARQLRRVPRSPPNAAPRRAGPPICCVMLFALAIAAGGAAGTLARYGISAWMAPVTIRFPFATLLINIAGSFLIGWLSREWSPVEDVTIPAPLALGLCR